MLTADRQFRGIFGCVACGSQQLSSEHTVVSPYFAFKAWSGVPELTVLNTCRTCGFKFYGRVLTEDEGNCYYKGYRDEVYFTERNRFEPFYTRTVHDNLSEQQGSEQRSSDLAAAVARVDQAGLINSILDYGGGDGSLIGAIPATKKIVFDPSGNTGRPGIEVVSERGALPVGVDLITCAQVLEHVSDPAALIKDMISLVRPSGMIYLEVPNQCWRVFPFLRPQKSFLSWLIKRPKLLLFGDIYSTLFRVKFGTLPPLGFVPMREHINFFTARALVELARRSGLSVKVQGMMSGSFFLIGEPSQQVED